MPTASRSGLFGDLDGPFELNSTTGSAPAQFASTSSGQMFFSADADTAGYGYPPPGPGLPPYGRELWVSGGSLSDTYMVEDFCWQCSSDPMSLTRGSDGFQEIIYFYAAGLGYWGTDELLWADASGVQRLSPTLSGVTAPEWVTPQNLVVWYSGLSNGVRSLYQQQTNAYPLNFGLGTWPLYITLWGSDDVYFSGWDPGPTTNTGRESG